MNEGERQVAPSLDGIRRDHVARYEWAAKVLPANSRVIDFACGVGYGTKILCEAGHTVFAFDQDAEALRYATTHYAHPAATFLEADAEHLGELPRADAAVCFETVEHVRDPRPLLKALRAAAPRLLISAPNEDVMPWSPAPGIVTAFHFRHYTKFTLAQVLAECGWKVGNWLGQAGPESEVENNLRGRTLIAEAVHGEIVAGAADAETPAGRHVAILGLGPSVGEYLEVTKRLGGRSKFCDEVWGINALGDVFACDLIFHMDDVRIQEIRANAQPGSNIAAMLKWITDSPVPIITSRAHPDYPALVEFPLEDVLNALGHDYFNSTAAYAIAFAIYTRATKISLFGLDFTYPNQHDAERGRACVEFWLGQAQARGIKLSMPTVTSLMDACYPRSQRLYGYDCVDVGFDVQADGSLKLAISNRATLPTAAEIEAAYDHSIPIADKLRKTGG